MRTITVRTATNDPRPLDEFELIRRCFRDRGKPRPGTVLGIGDDAAVLDTGGLPLVHARATVAFSERDDACAVACQVFGGALIRLAAQAVTPRWATLALTLEAGMPDWIEPFSAAVTALCDSCRIELIGGDTTRGPGRVTVFASGTEAALHRRAGTLHPRTRTVAVRLPLAAARAPEPTIARIVSTLVELAGHGAAIRCDDGPHTEAGRRTLELTAHTDAAGASALRALAGRAELAAEGPGSDG